MNNTALLLKSLREKMNISPSELAKMMNVNKSSISKWENEFSDDLPSIDNLYKLARLFRVSVDELQKGDLNEGKLIRMKEKYDLSKYDVLTLIKNKDSSTLVKYYQTIQEIKKNYIRLLNKAAISELNDIEIEEYKIVRKFYCINQYKINYSINYDSLHENGIDINEIRAYRAFMDSISSFSKEEKEWETAKVITHLNNIKLFEEEIIGSGLVEPFTEMIKLKSQLYKDGILNNAIRHNLLHFLQNPFNLALLENGANILISGSTHATIWDEKQIDAVINDIKEVKIEPKKSFYDSKYWYGDDCSYKEYIEYVDFKKTREYLDVMRLRKKDPWEYYQKLKFGDYDHLLDF